MIELDEMKNYLRVDFDDDDTLIDELILTARSLCQDILRSSDEELLDTVPAARTAILYCVAYLYEHREEADYDDMALTMRALLFADRKGCF